MPPKPNADKAVAIVVEPKPVAAAAASVATAHSSPASGIPWSLFNIAGKRLKNLGLPKLIELCNEREIKPGKTVHDCVELLLRWKEEKPQPVAAAAASVATAHPSAAVAPVVEGLARQAAVAPALQAAARQPSPPPPAVPLPAEAAVADSKPVAAAAAAISVAAPETARSLSSHGYFAPSLLFKMPADTAPTTGCVTRSDVTFVSWNIKKLSSHLSIAKLEQPGADHWQMRKCNILNTLRELKRTPNLIAVQELQSGDGGKHDGGKLAAEEITSALGPNWIQKYCDTQGEKTNERILFMWCGDHVMFRGRSPILSTLVFRQLDSSRTAFADDVKRRFSALSLTQFISTITDGKVCLAADLEREKNNILEGLKTEIENTAPNSFNFGRNPALLSFPADESTGLPSLHVLSFHLDTDPRQNRSEVYVLQSLMCIAWHHGVQLICMGDHNADQAQNSVAWHTTEPHTVAARAMAGILPRFEGLSRRVFPHDCTTNRYPYAESSKHNDDIFVPRFWTLKESDRGRVPKEAHDVVDLLACAGDTKARFAVLDSLWSDHKPLAATFEFEIRPVASGFEASAESKSNGFKDVLSQTPTPVKLKPVVGGGMRGGGEGHKTGGRN